MPNGVTLAGASQQLQTSLPTIFSEFMLLRDATGVCRSCATDMKLLPHEGASKNIINYNRVQAYNIDDGVDIAQAQTLSDNITTITPTEVAVQVILGGRTMSRIQDPDLLKRTGRILNNAYDLKEDTDGTLQFTSFTTSTLGSNSTVASPGLIQAAGARLDVGNNTAIPEPAPDPKYCILHPMSALVLAGTVVPFASTPAGAASYGAAGGAHAGTTVGPAANDGFSDSIQREGYSALGRYAGMTLKYDANIAVNSSSGAIGCAFAKDGFIYVSEVEPRLDPDTSDKSMRGAVELNLWGSYKWAVYRPAAYGQQITLDASLPTS